MGLWDGLDKAQVFEKGCYFKPGVYDVSIIRALAKQTQRSGLGFIVECEVIASSNPEHPIGSRATWFQSMKSPAIAFSGIKEFLIAALGLDARTDKDFIAREVDPHVERFMDRVTGTENALSGLFVHLETHMTKTKERGADFTVHRWEPFDFAGNNVTPPDVRALLHGAPAAPPPPPPVAPPPPALAIPPGAPRSPDGRHWWDGNAWRPV